MNDKPIIEKPVTAPYDGYEVEKTTSTNMAYKKNEYSIRPSIEDPYSTAYTYFKDENIGCFSSGSFDLITNFEFLNNNFYSLKNVWKPSTPTFQHWYSTIDGYFNYNYQILYYKREGAYYEIRSNDEQITKYTKVISLISATISILVYLIICFTNPLKW